MCELGDEQGPGNIQQEWKCKLKISYKIKHFM